MKRIATWILLLPRHIITITITITITEFFKNFEGRSP